MLYLTVGWRIYFNSWAGGRMPFALMGLFV